MMSTLVHVSVFLLDEIMLDFFVIELIIQHSGGHHSSYCSTPRVVFKFIFKIKKHQLMLCK